MSKCDCAASTAICGCISRGTGRLDYYGFWQFPCLHGNEFTPWDEDCEYHGKATVIRSGNTIINLEALVRMCEEKSKINN